MNIDKLTRIISNYANCGTERNVNGALIFGNGIHIWDDVIKDYEDITGNELTIIYNDDFKDIEIQQLKDFLYWLEQAHGYIYISR